MLRLGRALVVVVVASVLVAGLFASTRNIGPAKEKPYNPVIIPANFVGPIDNPFLPMVPGTTFFYEAETPDGLETNAVYISHNTKDHPRRRMRRRRGHGDARWQPDRVYPRLV